MVPQEDIDIQRGIRIRNSCFLPNFLLPVPLVPWTASLRCARNRFAYTSGIILMGMAREAQRQPVDEFVRDLLMGRGC